MWSSRVCLGCCMSSISHPSRKISGGKFPPFQHRDRRKVKFRTLPPDGTAFLAVNFGLPFSEISIRRFYVSIQHLMRTFHCFDPESRQIRIVPLVSRLVTFEVFSSGDQDGQPTFPVHYIGSQIVQTLLHFNKPIKIVNSLLEMETSQLKDLLCDPCGSHIMDAFVAGQYVGEKSREKLTHKLQVGTSPHLCSHWCV